jgi:hypothetical protein
LIRAKIIDAEKQSRKKVGKRKEGQGRKGGKGQEKGVRGRGKRVLHTDTEKEEIKKKKEGKEGISVILEKKFQKTTPRFRA